MMLSYLSIDCSSPVKVADVSNSTSGVDARTRLSNRRCSPSAVQLNRVGTAAGVRNRRRFPINGIFQNKLSTVKWSEQITVLGLTCKDHNSLQLKIEVHSLIIRFSDNTILPSSITPTSTSATKLALSLHKNLVLNYLQNPYCLSTHQSRNKIK